MSLPSIGHSVTGGTSPIPSHQAIGSNGSFWLPEKIDPSFGSKVKNSTPSKEGSRQGAGKPVVPANRLPERSRRQELLFRGEATVVGKTALGVSHSMLSLYPCRNPDYLPPRLSIEKPFFWIGPFRPPIGSGANTSCSTGQNHPKLQPHQLPSGGQFQRVRFAKDQEGKGKGDKHGANRGAKCFI